MVVRLPYHIWVGFVCAWPRSKWIRSSGMRREADLYHTGEKDSEDDGISDSD